MYVVLHIPVNNNLLDDSNSRIWKEVFAPARKWVCLHDEPPGIERVPLQSGVQGVYREHVAGGGIGVSPPVATDNLRPGQGNVMLCLPVLHVSTADQLRPHITILAPSSRPFQIHSINTFRYTSIVYMCILHVCLLLAKQLYFISQMCRWESSSSSSILVFSNLPNILGREDEPADAVQPLR